MEWFIGNTHWVWIILGVLLMITEVFGASGYLLVSGLAALSLAAITFFVPTLALKWQLLLFALELGALAVVVTFWFRSRDTASQGPDVGKPGSDLIGRTVKLTQAVEDNRSRIRLQDANWDLYCDTPSLSAGARVRVDEVKGRTLIVTPVS